MLTVSKVALWADGQSPLCPILDIRFLLVVLNTRRKPEFVFWQRSLCRVTLLGRPHQALVVIELELTKALL